MIPCWLHYVFSWRSRIIIFSHILSLDIVSIKYIFKFMYLFWEKERAGEGQGGERIPSSLCPVSAEPDVEIELINRETMTWAETRAERLTDGAIQAPPELSKV